MRIIVLKCFWKSVNALRKNLLSILLTTYVLFEKLILKKCFLGSSFENVCKKKLKEIWKKTFKKIRKEFQKILKNKIERSFEKQKFEINFGKKKLNLKMKKKMKKKIKSLFEKKRKKDFLKEKFWWRLKLDADWNEWYFSNNSSNNLFITSKIIHNFDIFKYQSRIID